MSLKDLVYKFCSSRTNNYVTLPNKYKEIVLLMVIQAWRALIESVVYQENLFSEELRIMRIFSCELRTGVENFKIPHKALRMWI